MRRKCAGVAGNGISSIDNKSAFSELYVTSDWYENNRFSSLAIAKARLVTEELASFDVNRCTGPHSTLTNSILFSSDSHVSVFQHLAKQFPLVVN